MAGSLPLVYLPGYSSRSHKLVMMPVQSPSWMWTLRHEFLGWWTILLTAEWLCLWPLYQIPRLNWLILIQGRLDWNPTFLHLLESPFTVYEGTELVNLISPRRPIVSNNFLVKFGEYLEEAGVKQKPKKKPRKVYWLEDRKRFKNKVEVVFSCRTKFRFSLF